MNIAMDYLRRGYQILVTKETREGLSKMVGYIPTFSSSKRFHVVYMKDGQIKTKSTWCIKSFKNFNKIIDGKKLLLTKKYKRISIKYVTDKNYVYILEIDNAVSLEEMPDELKEKYTGEEGAVYAFRYGEQGDHWIIIGKVKNGERKKIYEISPAMRYKKQTFKEAIKHLKIAGERFSRILKEYREMCSEMDIKEIKI
jgi:hypothetical protein